MSFGSIFLTGIFLITLITDIPIVYGLLIASVLYLTFFEVAPYMAAAQQYVAGLDSFTLLAIPLFILAGELMNQAGLTKRIVRLCSAIVGDMRGGLAVVAVLACLTFGALSGSGVADVVAIGGILLPAMARAGYDKGFSAALVGSAGATSTIIPPSIVLIIYGTISNTSVGKLFMAGIIPGLLLGAALIAVAIWQSRKHGWAGGQPFSKAEFSSALYSALPALMIPILIIGGIRFGFFTATEAAASAIVYALICGVFVYRTISLAGLWHSLKATSEVSASILLLIGASSLFAWGLVMEQVPQSLASFITTHIESRIWILLLLTLILLLLGTIMEAIPIIIIIVPVVMPLLELYNIDPIHFGILLAINMAIGANSPPVGVDLMAACKTSGISMMETLRPLTWMIGAMILIMLLLTFVPELVLYLPRTLD
ncbi:TRAP transporter large permease [Advenella sp. WQ 585]|uniref:TRAP transporter large permease protein n=1 Tax=Advenella mandrilli TaxID=2800330 RepID=A0ABS1E9H4_9BURK|nr:TRAP transporter large permease [Advenella mandrilli]MBK1780397.1 TRAP transporter large permease [Advenella mandrilli]NLY34622.1 TRAP transporter large permease [Alcaligenaceae bacterium]